MRGWPASPTARLAALGGGLAAVDIGALAIHVPGADTVGSVARANLFVAVLAVALALYLAAVRMSLRAAFPRGAVWVVLAVAVATRAALLPSPPFLSSDVYRYVWDGRVQAAGINPYLHVPADPTLAPLRDDAVYPLINRRDYARTIYPPTAELVFAAVGRVADGVGAMKLAMLGFEALGVVCALALLRAAALPPERVLIYAWNPLPLWSFALDGHVDAVAVGLVGLALLLRVGRRWNLAAAALAAAALVKVLPVALAPALVRGGRLWRPMIVGAVVGAVLYLPYLAAGRDLFGFAAGYGAEEGYDTGRGYWLLAGLGHLGLDPAAALRPYLLAAAAALAATALWIAFGRRAAPPGAGGRAADARLLCRDAAVLAALVTCAASPHYAWYYPWLSLPAVVAPIPAVVWLGSAPVLFLIDPFNDRFLWPALVFGPALVLAARSLWAARGRAA